MVPPSFSPVAGTAELDRPVGSAGWIEVADPAVHLSVGGAVSGLVLDAWLGRGWADSVAALAIAGVGVGAKEASWCGGQGDDCALPFAVREEGSCECGPTARAHDPRIAHLAEMAGDAAATESASRRSAE
jgi:hypothetical protein